MRGQAGRDLVLTVEDAVAALHVRPDRDGWTGHMPEVWGPTVFGGFVVGQAVFAATRGAPDGRRMHSLHAYFLRPVLGGKPIFYRVESVRQGRTLALQRLEAEQDDQHVLTMNCSFTADADGYEYQASPPFGTSDPDALATDSIGPWTIARIGPTPPEPDGSRRSTHRMWFRSAAPYADDPHLEAALVAYASDITWTGGRPLHLDGDTRGIVSIDHAVWFHRPLRVDSWSYYDVHSLVNAGGRGLLRGAMYSRDGRLCVSVSQEMILRRYEDVR